MLVYNKKLATNLLTQLARANLKMQGYTVKFLQVSLKDLLGLNICTVVQLVDQDTLVYQLNTIFSAIISKFSSLRSMMCNNGSIITTLNSMSLFK